MTFSYLPPMQRKRKTRPIEIDGDVAIVTLGCGKKAILDAADAHIVDGRNWNANRGPGGRICAGTQISLDGGRQDVALMHRVLMSAPDDIHVDHINGDPLDNRRGNLRLATNQQNSWNSKRASHNTSGYKGVSWHSRDLAYSAYIRVDGRQKMLGYFDDPISAARAYDRAAREHYGEFARPNFQDAC